MIRRLAANAAWLVPLVFMAGCASVPRNGAPAASFPRPLASPVAAGEHTVRQVVRGAAGSSEMTLSCVVSVNDGRMSVVGLNAMGVRLFTIGYDGKQVSVDKSFAVPDAITPDRLLADLQLVYWPLESLRDTLRSAKLELSEPDPGMRRLRRGDRLVAEVHYAQDVARAWSGRAWLVNFEFGYSLQIDSQPL